MDYANGKSKVKDDGESGRAMRMETRRLKKTRRHQTVTILRGSKGGY